MANGKAQKRRIRALMAETGMNYTKAMCELEKRQAQAETQVNETTEDSMDDD